MGDGLQKHKPVVWAGADVFGDRIVAVEGKSGSVILGRARDDDPENMQTISMDRKSAVALARWILDEHP